MTSTLVHSSSSGRRPRTGLDLVARIVAVQDEAHGLLARHRRAHLQTLAQAPETQKADAVLPLADFLIHRLTGHFATDLWPRARS